MGSRFPKKTGVDQSQRHCSAETIRDTGHIRVNSDEAGQCPKIRSKGLANQRRLSNRREQILHFDLSPEARSDNERLQIRFFIISLSLHILHKFVKEYGRNFENCIILSKAPPSQEIL